MTHTLSTDQPLLATASRSICAGAIASLLTQPLEVLKTNMINSPALYMAQLHAKIVSHGWMQYMRGGTVAVIRQAYGFTIYTTIISYLNRELDPFFQTKKYYKYSVAALVGKMTAMVFEAPLTLLKTRLEAMPSRSIGEEMREIMNNPRQQILKGLKATLAREAVYSLIQYNLYRFFKDDIFMKRMNKDTAFIPAFLAGTIAILASQPLQVIRSVMSLQLNLSLNACVDSLWKNHGWRGFFLGVMPRLCRKPLNSGICWAVLETVKDY